MKTYKNDFTNRIAFPLGGLGAGSISLAGNGILVDPEINNRPCRESICDVSSFAVRAEKDGKTVDCRMLCGDRTVDLPGTLRGAYGQGDILCSGFRHFDSCEFEAEFPFARVKLADSVFPATAVMEAFNPFIPSNDRDSSIPAAFFDIKLTNTAEESLSFTVILNMTNMLEKCGLNIYGEANGIKYITLNSADTDKSSEKYGNITVATDCESTSHTDYWFRGNWFDRTTMFKNDLMSPGELKNRAYDELIENGRDTATLAARADIAPGESKVFRFLISWYVPNAECYWGEKEKDNYRNYYSTIFDSSQSVAAYCFENRERLYCDTRLFADRLYGSSLPPEVTEAIGANIAILKSTTCLRLEDGSFWAWEGVNRTSGSCEGSCQHVYNYAYALALLFPELEKGLRDNEIKSCLDKNGKMAFRMPISLQPRDSWRACADGQMGFVIKCYREWKLSGDSEWLKKNWASIKSALEYAWSSENPDRWDPQKSGVMNGRQHHTLDVELFGVYSWLSGMYHAALTAAAKMADFLGEADKTREYTEICENGKRLLDAQSFNGEYFVHLTDVTDKSLITEYTQNSAYKNLVDKGDDTAYYWDDGVGQSKYQIENGCEIDQVLAAWHADLNGLGEIFNPEHRKSALKAIYKYNFKSMHDLLNPCRVFACNDEKGVVMCTWPDNVRKPAIPVPYSEECMTGFEYAVAANMLQCGMENEALEIVREIRRRYDGKRRNPFAEIECGASYGRAMASYSFMLIYSGFIFDLPNKSLGFKPIYCGRYFWSVNGAWGNVEYKEKLCSFTVDYGKLNLKHFITEFDAVKTVEINGKAIHFTSDKGTVNADMELKQGDLLCIKA